MSSEVKLKITADTSGVEKGVAKAKKDVSDLGNNSKGQASGISDAFGKLGKVVAGAFSVKAVIDFGKEVLQTGLQFEDSMAKVQALTGASGEQFEDLTELARNMGATTRYSASEAADAMGYLGMAGWDAQQMMDGLPSLLSLASASGTDLAKTADILSDVMQQFGAEASEAGRFADVFAKTASSTNTNVQMLGQSMKHVGTISNQLGLEVHETSAMLGIMANNGVKAGQAGRHLKIILSRLSSDMDPVTQGLKKLGVEVKNSDGSMKDMNVILEEMKGKFDGLSEAERINTAKLIAGSDAMASFLALVQGGGDDLNTLINSIDKSSGAADQMAATMEDTLGGSLRTLNSVWEETKLKIYDFAGPVARGFVDATADMLRGIGALTGGGETFREGFVGSVTSATEQIALPFQDMNRMIQTTADELMILGGTVTPEAYNTFLENTVGWVDKNAEILDTKYAEDLAMLQKFFADNKNITETEQALMLSKLEERYAKEREITQTNTDKILEIIAGAKEEERNLEKSEIEEIQRLQKDNYERLLKMISTSKDEELALLKGKKFESKAIEQEAYENAYATALETKNKIVAEANEQRDQEILAAHRLKEMCDISEEQYQAMLETADSNYTEIYNSANENFEEIKKTVSDKAIEMNKTFNLETGKMKNTWASLVREARQNQAVYKAEFQTTIKKNTIETYQKQSGNSIHSLAPSTVSSRMGYLSTIDVTPSSDYSYNNSNLSISMGGVTVREESDIKKIAQELYKLQNRNMRGQGRYV